MDRLNNITYFSEPKYFKIKHYQNAHIKAHKQILDVGHNGGIWLDDEIKSYISKQEHISSQILKLR